MTFIVDHIKNPQIDTHPLVVGFRNKTALNTMFEKRLLVPTNTLKLKDSKNAIALFEQAIAADPANAPLMTDYAQALTVRINEFNFMAKGMIAGKMLKAYKTSVEIDPNHIVGWIGLSRYYLNAPPIAGGSADKAETYAKEILARVPFLGNVEMGLVEEKRGNNEKAA